MRPTSFDAQRLGAYGFRPGRNQHDALDALAVGILRKKVNWVLDADIRNFYDAIDHGWLVKFIEHRVGDERMMRLIKKWLAAGVMENGEWAASEVGAPQGATASPLLANVYLHYVLEQSGPKGSSRSLSAKKLAESPLLLALARNLPANAFETG